MKFSVPSVATLALSLLGIGQAWGGSTQCEPATPRVPRGLVVRAALGPAFWLGEVGRFSRPGFGFTLGAGYEFFPWLALEASWSSGLHDTDQPKPPEPGSFATQAIHLGARVGLSVGPVDIFARGGMGLLCSRPDILVRIPEFDGEVRFSWLGGLGGSWHTPRRQIWIGLEWSAVGADGFPGILVFGSVVIGFTL